MIDNFLIFQLLIIFIIPFLSVLLFLCCRFLRFNKFLTNSSKFAKQGKKMSLLRKRRVINPVAMNGISCFKVYKLNNNLKLKKFFDYDKNIYTIFIKREWYYENYKNIN